MIDRAKLKLRKTDVKPVTFCRNCGDRFDAKERPCPRPAAPLDRWLKDCGRGGHIFNVIVKPWERFSPVACDLCDSIAVWRHPDGGYRCRKCPRP